MIKTNNQHYVNPFLVSFNSEKYILSSYLNTLCATRFRFFTYAWPQPFGNLFTLITGLSILTCTTMFVETYVSGNWKENAHQFFLSKTFHHVLALVVRIPELQSRSAFLLFHLHCQLPVLSLLSAWPPKSSKSASWGHFRLLLQATH